MSVPLTRPRPPRLSEAGDRLRAIELSNVYSNFGPVNTRFEEDIVDRMFGGVGTCTTVCNATIGLMLAIREAVGRRPTQKRYALMPSFTFAATAHAAIWCGLTPLFCDIDPVTWAASAEEEENLLARYGDEIAAVVPYATFGYDIDLERYEAIMDRYNVPVVVDAASSLGTISATGGFGTGFAGTVVFSMHATKSFATGEAGLVYSGDEDRVRKLRLMSNFGFGEPRSATMPGLNGKLSEIGALLCQLRLEQYDEVLAHRESVMRRYREALPQLTFQPLRQHRQAHQFAAALVPKELADGRRELSSLLTEAGIGNGAYFSPHLSQQSYFAEHAVWNDLTVTDDIAGRVISLPMFDTITAEQVAEVASAVNVGIAQLKGFVRSPAMW